MPRGRADGRQPGCTHGSHRAGTHAAMELLDDAAIDLALADLDGWRREGDALRRDVRMPTFMEAIRLIDRIALVAEEADHHPEITNVYWNVGLRLTTHDAGGITDRDLALARALDAVVAVEGP